MPIRAFVLINTKPGKSEEIVKARRIKGVKLANSVFGRYDAVLVIEARDMQQLREIIYEVIQRNPYVTHTETLISFQPHS